MEYGRATPSYTSFHFINELAKTVTHNLANILTQYKRQIGCLCAPRVRIEDDENGLDGSWSGGGDGGDGGPLATFAQRIFYMMVNYVM